MAITRSRVLVAVTGIAVLTAAVLVTFGSVGCYSADSAAAATQYKSPGVYIVSVEAFGAGFAGFVRDANPVCD